MPENRESHAPSASHRLFVLPAFSPPHLPYYRVGPLLWTFTLKTRRLFPYPSPPCCHCSSNPAGAMGKKHRLLTFHITESGQLCNHLPSKKGMLFAEQRPLFTIVSEKSNWSRSEVLPSHLPYHRLGPLLPPFTLKNQAVFREGRSPTDIDRSYPHAGYIHIKKAFGPKNIKILVKCLIPAKTPSHLPYYRLGALLPQFILKIRSVFRHPSPPF